MFRRFLEKTLSLDESPLVVVRSSWVRYWWTIVVLGLTLIATAFFLYPAVQLGRVGVVVVLAVLVLVLGAIARVLWMRTFSVWVVTNRRVIDIDQRGLFDRHVAELPLDHVEEIRYNTSGIVATLSRTGTVVIVPRSGRGHLALEGVSSPASVKDRVAEVCRHHTKTEESEQENEL